MSTAQRSRLELEGQLRRPGTVPSLLTPPGAECLAHSKGSVNSVNECMKKSSTEREQV